MEKLVILDRLVIIDYKAREVHVYSIYPDVEVDNVYIRNLGYDVNNCVLVRGDLSFVVHPNETLRKEFITYNSKQKKRL